MSKRRSTRSQAPEYLADFLFISTHTLMKEAKLDEDTAVKLAHLMAKRMCENWSKQLIYWPAYDSQELLVRDAKIFQDIRGDNFSEVAHKYDLSVQCVYRIYKTVLTEEVAKRQRNFTFD